MLFLSYLVEFKKDDTIIPKKYPDNYVFVRLNQ